MDYDKAMMATDIQDRLKTLLTDVKEQAKTFNRSLDDSTVNEILEEEVTKLVKSCE